ncbi:MAG TPA: SDR family NAD(P)-dependent oxidoreductase [Kofleriaceae bacterium]|nr:SDR family NAD(P)-dependent oxidoreductase [Kofleriaceae bacterium]
MTRVQIQHWLLEHLAIALKLRASDIDIREPLARYGLDSARVVALSGQLERLLGRPLSPTLVFEHPTVEALAAHLAGDRSEAEPAAPPPAADGEPIAIIGLACRFPGAASPRAYWELLSRGADAVRETPPERWNADDYYDADPGAPGKMTTRWGGFIDGVDQFDPHFFGISPREALEMDPQQRLLLEISSEALEDAGLPVPSLARSRTGVFVGISHNEYGALVGGEQRIGAQTGAGNALSIAANRVSYAFDFHGPSLAVDTACSSSLTATHLACRSLRSGESSLAIVAGANLLLSPVLAISFTKAGLMSPDGRCKAFDARANGYVRGEGVGVVVLKPLSRAQADGDAIYAVIRGSAMTQDGRSNGLMAPSPRAQQAVIRGACSDARVDPSEIQYVEAHGTGTFLGDPIELGALGAVVSADRPPARPCIVGSVKSNIGHLEAAAGVASLIKVALMMRHGAIPPSLHFERPNPGIPFDELRLRVPTRVEPWTGPRLAGISSFGFGGTNVHVVVESAPPRAMTATTRDAPCVLPVSARSAAALRTLAGRYGELVTAPGAAPIGEIARAAGQRRTHHPHRLAVVAASAAQAHELLEAARAGKRSRNLIALERSERDPDGKPPAARRVAFVFSGQGTQWAGMAGPLSAGYPVARAALERIDRELRKHAAWSSRSLIEELSADPSRLAETELAQPAIFAIQVALAELLRSWGITPHAVVGHSVGEIAAAHVAGILSLGDAVRVVANRARLMQRATGHGAMASIALAEPAARAAIAGEPGVSIAAINGPTDTVIAGPPDAVARAVNRLEAAGVTARSLGVSYAFHTAQMDPFLPELIDALRGIEPASGTIPMISTVTGEVIAPRFLHAEYWARNMREPVAFHAAARALIAGGHELVIELGPHPALGRYVVGAAAVCETLRRDEPAAITLGRALATAYVHGAEIDWRAVAGDAATTVELPSHPWHHERYWPDTRPAAPGRRGDEHPLLCTHIGLAGDGVDAWQITPAADRIAYLGDHRVAGRPVLPAAAYFEIAMSAAAQLAGDPRRATTIDDLELHEMLALDEAAVPTFQTIARERDGQRWIELHTRDAGGDWIRRASARLGAAATADPPPRTPIAEIRQRCFEPVATAGLYRELAEHGLDYGPAFRGLTEVWRRGGEAIGRLELPEPLLADRAAYAVHPALLDACLHVIGPALPPARTDRERASVLVPIRAGRLRLIRRATASLWSHVTLRPHAGADARTEQADIRLLDDAGDTIAEITGLVLRRIARARPTVAKPATGAWRYAIEWRAVSPPPRTADPGPGDRWLVLADQGGVGARIVRALEQRGASCLVVERAGARSHPASLEVDPSSPDAMRALIRDRLGQAASVRGVLHLWSLDAPPAGALDTVALARAQSSGVGSTLDLVQSLASAGPVEPPRLWLVTRGAVHVAGAGGGIAQSPMWGLGKAIAFEQPELACTMIDLDPADGAGAPEQLAEQLIDALARPDRENQIALRGAGRYVPRLAPSQLFACPRRGVATDALTSDATYLITGGLGALGLLVAGWLIERGARNLVLLGRRGPTPEVAARLAELRQRARIAVEPVDVADPSRLAAALDRARGAMPPLRGVVHAAAVLDDGALLDLSRERLTSVLAPKVLGAWNLHALTAGDPIDFFVMFSSAVSVLGSPGQANYIAANTFLDALAHHRRTLELPAVSINWGPWAEIGLAAETAQRARAEDEARAHLVKMIAPERGLALLAEILLAAAPQVTILPFDVRNVLQFYPDGAGISLFSDVLREDLQALKVDAGERRLYARPDISQSYVAPRNDVEQIIAGIWQRALTLDRVGIHDNFFELGGDSVFAGQVVSRINKAFGVKISLSDAFTSVSVAHLGQLVQEHLMSKLEELSDDQVERALQQGS